MSDPQSGNEQMVRYLLGDALSEAEQEAIEQRYFTDDLYFDRLVAVEDDLIDSYIRGTLSGVEKSLFETHFLTSSRRRERWEAQRAIASFFRAQAEQRNLAAGFVTFVRSQTLGGRLLAGAVVFAAVMAIGLTASSYIKARRENVRLESQIDALRRQSAEPPVLATLVLKAKRLRSGSGEEFQLPKETRWVVLRVELPELASGISVFEAGLSTPNGEQVWYQKGIPGVGSALETGVPAWVLKRGDYVLSLSGMEGASRREFPSYQFRID